MIINNEVKSKNGERMGVDITPGSRTRGGELGV